MQAAAGVAVLNIGKLQLAQVTCQVAACMLLVWSLHWLTGLHACCLLAATALDQCL
jgi:hypothetical protein